MKQPDSPVQGSKTDSLPEPLPEAFQTVSEAQRELAATMCPAWELVEFGNRVYGGDK